MLCACGCKQDAGTYMRTRAGYVKGDARRYVPGHAHAKPHELPGITGAARSSEMRRQKKRRWRANHLDERRRKDRERTARDPQANRDKVRTWRLANPDRVRALKREAQARRRARLAGVVTESVDVQIVWERDEGVCGICGEHAEPADWHLDHVIPISRGGAHTYENVRVSHPACNVRKGARLDSEVACV